MKKTICLRVIGGLGNQLFIYGFGRAWSLRNKRKLLFDMKTGFVKDVYGRVPKLDKYISNFPSASRMIVGSFLLTKQFPFLSWILFKSKFYKEPNSRSLFDVGEGDIDNVTTLYIQGYFQSYKYFEGYETIIKSDLVFNFKKSVKVTGFAEQISKESAISIHVRRVQYSNLLDLDYYIEAISIMKQNVKNPSFFVFSDDIEWCRNNFPYVESLHFINHDMTDEAADLWLMSLCKHHIIANSSFSWWGAWLSIFESKIVIAPKNTQIGIEGELYPREWILI